MLAVAKMDGEEVPSDEREVEGGREKSLRKWQGQNVLNIEGDDEGGAEGVEGKTCNVQSIGKPL